MLGPRRHVDGAMFAFGRGNRVPRRRISLDPFWIGLNPVAKLSLLRLLLLHQFLIAEPLVFAGQRLLGIFEAEDQRRRLARLLGAARAEASQHIESAFDDVD